MCDRPLCRDSLPFLLSATRILTLWGLAGPQGPRPLLHVLVRLCFPRRKAAKSHLVPVVKSPGTSRGTPLPARRGPHRPSQSQYLAPCSGETLPLRPSSPENHFCPEPVPLAPPPSGAGELSPTQVPLRLRSRATPQPFAIFVPVSCVGTAVLEPLFPGSWAGKCSSCSPPPCFFPR